jgi:hypothetical protein
VGHGGHDRRLFDQPVHRRPPQPRGHGWPWTAGVIDGGDVPKYLIGEFVGAFIGAALVVAAYWDHFRETEDPGLKLAVFSTGPAIRNYPMNVVTRSSARSCWCTAS